MTYDTMDDVVGDAAQRILAVRSTVPSRRAVLVAISGIDGSGKGYVTALIERALRANGSRVANINIDGWLHLPERRFDPERPAEHFLANGIRFDEMFRQLVLPLRNQRAIELSAQHADGSSAPNYFTHQYSYSNIDVILLEGIFLLRRDFRRHFDLAIWIDCTFETALERALKRGQEGLPPEQVIRDYQTIYFAAQKLHCQRDHPRQAANLVITNDARLAAASRVESVATP